MEDEIKKLKETINNLEDIILKLTKELDVKNNELKELKEFWEEK